MDESNCLLVATACGRDNPEILKPEVHRKGGGILQSTSCFCAESQFCYYLFKKKSLIKRCTNKPYTIFFGISCEYTSLENPLKSMSSRVYNIRVDSFRDHFCTCLVNQSLPKEQLIITTCFMFILQ